MFGRSRTAARFVSRPAIAVLHWQAGRNEVRPRVVDIVLERAFNQSIVVSAEATRALGNFVQTASQLLALKRAGQRVVAFHDAASWPT